MLTPSDIRLALHHYLVEERLDRVESALGGLHSLPPRCWKYKTHSLGPYIKDGVPFVPVHHLAFQAWPNQKRMSPNDEQLSKLLVSLDSWKSTLMKHFQMKLLSSSR